MHASRNVMRAAAATLDLAPEPRPDETFLSSHSPSTVCSGAAARGKCCQTHIAPGEHILLLSRPLRALVGWGSCILFLFWGLLICSLLHVSDMLVLRPHGHCHQPAAAAC